jgi:hypothetical protein
VIGAPGRSQKPEPDPVGIPPKVHRAWCARHGRLVPVAGRAEGLSQVNLGTFDAIEVCPEPKSRGAVRLGFPRCEPAILADLPKVSDVKERSEERLLGRSPVGLRLAPRPCPPKRALIMCSLSRNQVLDRPPSAD